MEQRIGACHDPKEEKFPACTLEGGAHYLVGSDNDPLDVRRFETVCIVNPGQFLLAWELVSLTSQEMAACFERGALAAIMDTICLEPDTRSRLLEVLTLTPC